MKTIRMTDEHYEALKVLVDRGIEDLHYYLENGDPRVDGYSDEEAEDLRRLRDVDADAVQRALAGLEPPPGYKILADGVIDPFYAIRDNDLGEIVSATYDRRERAVQAAWSDYRARLSHGT